MSNRANSMQGRNVQRKIQEHPDPKIPIRPTPQNSPGLAQNTPKLGKLSISDAIGLITIRLSKLEEFMIRMEGNPSTISDNNTLLMSLGNRLNSLESYITAHNPEDSTTESDYIPQSEDPESWENRREGVLNNLSTFKSDIDDIRKLVIKLQSVSL